MKYKFIFFLDDSLVSLTLNIILHQKLVRKRNLKIIKRNI